MASNTSDGEIVRTCEDKIDFANVVNRVRSASENSGLRYFFNKKKKAAVCVVTDEDEDDDVNDDDLDQDGEGETAETHSGQSSHHDESHFRNLQK